MSRSFCITPLLCVATIAALLVPGVSFGAGKTTPALERALAEPGAAVRVWIFLRDKGPNAEARLAEVERNLDERSRARRSRARGDNLVDMLDVPVYESYVDELTRAGLDVRHASRWLNAVSVDITRERLDAITALSFVDRVDRVRSHRGPLHRDFDEPTSAAGPAPAPPGNRTTTATLDYGDSFTQNDQINVAAMHALGFDGNTITIAVLDAGFNNPGHEALLHLDIIATWDFVNGDSVVQDEGGQMGSGNHGTYVLSTLAGFMPTQLIGPAYGARFLLAKTENTSWERHIEEDDWIAGAEWADGLGADIINSSLTYRDGFTNGEPDYSWTDMDGNTTIVTIGADIAASRGILVVTSAGNAGDDINNTLGGPADGDSVLTIGAVDALGLRASFSSVGPTADARIKPDVMAMGVATKCASPSGTTTYAYINGTSLSCPLVSGAAALVMQANPTMSNLEIADRLRNSGDNSSTPDKHYGWGIIDAMAAAFPTVDVAPALDARGPILHHPVPNPFNPSTTVSFTLTHPARVVLRVFDARGALVADLLDEERPAGTGTHTWNGTSSSGSTLPSGVYFLRLDAAGSTRTAKITLLK